MTHHLRRLIILSIPHILAWELYCNEIENRFAKVPVYREEDLRGFWLIKPNGALGIGGKYLVELRRRSTVRKPVGLSIGSGRSTIPSILVGTKTHNRWAVQCGSS